MSGISGTWLESRRARIFLFSLLYASEGAPIGFIWWMLPTFLRERGGPVSSITGLLAAVTALWALKFLWAPLVDATRARGFGLPLWIALAQLAMVLSLLPVLALDPAEQLSLLGFWLVVHALAATTQDIAIDALVVHCVPLDELGRVNGWMSAGKHVGRGLFGGIGLLAAAHWGFPAVVVLLMVVLLLPLPFLLSLPRSLGALPAREGRARLPWSAMFRGPTVRRALLFALFAGTGFEAIGALSGIYLVDRGLGSDEIAWLRTFPILFVIVAGGLSGGALTDRLGPHRATRLSLAGLVLSHGALVIVERGMGGTTGPILVLLSTYFLYGTFIASSYALFMSLVDPRIAATQFSLFMAATNGCESLASWAGGRLVEGMGYAFAFAVVALVSALCLPLTPAPKET